MGEKQNMYPRGKELPSMVLGGGVTDPGKGASTNKKSGKARKNGTGRGTRDCGGNQTGNVFNMRQLGVWARKYIGASQPGEGKGSKQRGTSKQKGHRRNGGEMPSPQKTRYCA